MTFWDLITVVGVFLGIGYIILSRISEKKPKTIEKLKQILPNKLYEKISIDESDKLKQVWDEKRSLI